MPVKIEQVHDRPRRCGLRHKGLYLMGESFSRECGRLPIPLDHCPVCGQRVDPARSAVPGYKGLNVSRAWTIVNLAALREHRECRAAEPEVVQVNGRKRTTLKTRGKSLPCNSCLINTRDTAHMLWVGADNYTPTQFLQEAAEQGISKRIPGLPKDFVLGESVVALASQLAIVSYVADPEHGRQVAVHTPGIFALFMPTHVEYVTDGSETEAELQRYLDRGIQPVRVVVDEDTQAELPMQYPDEARAAAEQAKRDY